MALRELTKLGDIDPAGELSDTSCTLRKECHFTDDYDRRRNWFQRKNSDLSDRGTGKYIHMERSNSE